MNANSLLEKHKKAKLPSFPFDDGFAEWVEELIELDGYYYGSAFSLLNGEKIFCDTDAYLNLKEKLSKFKDLEEDSNVYHDAKEYLDSLEKVVNLIKDISSD